MNNAEASKFKALRIIDVNSLYSRESMLDLVYNTDAINNMIHNILVTTPGERPWEPEFGSEIPLLIWENINDITARRIEMAIYDALYRWMPYITIDLANTTVVPVPTSVAFDVKLYYMVKVEKLNGEYRVRLKRES